MRATLALNGLRTRITKLGQKDHKERPIKFTLILKLLIMLLL